MSKACCVQSRGSVSLARLFTFLTSRLLPRLAAPSRIALSYRLETMANTYSALKRVRQADRRTEFNRMNRSILRHQIRAMRRALAGKDQKAAADLLPKTFSLIDKSAKKGVIKKNTAARYKSKLHARVKAMAAAA